MDMHIETLVVGPIETNCYIVSDPDTKEAVIIDAGDEAPYILNYIAQHDLKVTMLLNTHGHYDHTQANDAIREVTGASLGIHCDDVDILTVPEKVSSRMMVKANPCKAPEQLLHNGDIISFGKYNLQVIYTPGHTKGGCCFYEASEKVCFTGDTLFKETIGRADLYGGHYPTLLHSVRERLSVLPDDVVIYPGHGEDSTMGYERKKNPYLKG
jgi:glyoxylase-like metal-dependent hydrolase (beta-lactamase superfamily II)